MVSGHGPQGVAEDLERCGHGPHGVAEDRERCGHDPHGVAEDLERRSKWSWTKGSSRGS